MPASPERWQDVERLYHAALEHEPTARAAWLEAACAGDASLRAEVQSLLDYDESAQQFLTRSVLEGAARRLPVTRPGALVGRQIHGYEIQELLGVGGMGEVYRATDLRLGRDVALKILQQSETTDPGYVRRFEDEARSASGLNHPNIVTIYGVGEDHDLRYIAMECVVGRTLGQVIADGTPALADAIDLAVQLADALAVAHDNGIIHRDLKPENVMVTPEGRLKVLDFGIAKRENSADVAVLPASGLPQTSGSTEAGQILGTVGYMSPEQAQGRRASAASDQFSFGAILYEMLCGRRAFARPTRAATLEAIQWDAPDTTSLPNTRVGRLLRELLDRCLAKDPSARFASSRDLARELRAIRERLDRQPLTRREVMWAGLAATGVFAAAGVGTWFAVRPGPTVRALALLPFENAAKDPDLEHLCNGLTDALILGIGVLPSIRVMPHSLVSNFRRRGLDARAFAQEVGSDAYLYGSVDRRAGRLTIVASLFEVVTGKTLWSNSFTRPDADIQAAQDEIVSAIVFDGIQLQLSEDERRRLVQRPTDNAEAYDLYLRALLLHDRQTFEDLMHERELLARAIDLDPKFAKAYAALAGTYTTAAIDGYEAPGECWPSAQAYVREALSRDPELPDGYAQTAAREFFFEWDFPAAEENWGEALRTRTASMYPPLRVGKALQEFALGRTSEAVRTMAEVRKVDRFSPIFVFKEALFLRGDGQLERAAAGFEEVIRALPADPKPWFALADVRFAQQRYEEAVGILRRVLAEDPFMTTVLASATGADGYRQIVRTHARLWLDRWDMRARAGHYVAPIDRAKDAAQAGLTNLAFQHLDDAFDVRDPGVLLLKVDRAWAELRDHPRFHAAVKKLNLP